MFFLFRDYIISWHIYADLSMHLVHRIWPGIETRKYLLNEQILPSPYRDCLLLLCSWEVLGWEGVCNFFILNPNTRLPPFTFLWSRKMRPRYWVLWRVTVLVGVCIWEILFSEQRECWTRKHKPWPLQELESQQVTASPVVTHVCPKQCMQRPACFS